MIDVLDLPLPDPESVPEYDGPEPRPEYFHAWLKTVTRMDEAHQDALREAVGPIQLWISRDACRHSRELWPLFAEISLRLGDPRLSAYSVRRGAGIEDSSILERFRKEVGLSVTDYIYHRRQETVVRLVYTSDLSLEDIASMLGYRIEYAVSNIVRMWSRGRWSPAELRHEWREWGFDPVILRWVERGEAMPEQAEQVLEQLERMRLRNKQAREGVAGDSVERGD